MQGSTSQQMSAYMLSSVELRCSVEFIALSQIGVSYTITPEELLEQNDQCAARERHLARLPHG